MTKEQTHDDLPALAADYKKIRADYDYDGGPFCADEARVKLLKKILKERLTDVERTLIILYIDYQSYRKLGKRLGLSHTVVAKEIRRIKEKVLAEYNELTNVDRERISNTEGNPQEGGQP